MSRIFSQMQGQAENKNREEKNVKREGKLEGLSSCNKKCTKVQQKPHRGNKKSGLNERPGRVNVRETKENQSKEKKYGTNKGLTANDKQKKK